MITASTSMAHGDTFLDERMERRRVIDRYHQRRMEAVNRSCMPRTSRVGKNMAPSGERIGHRV
jgi:hypothetical protein